MKVFDGKNPKKLFGRIFIPFLCCTISIVFVSTWLYYFNFEKVATQMIHKSSVDNLDSIALNVNEAKEIVSSVASQAYFDESIFNLMYYEDLSTTETIKYLSRLSSYKNAFPYIHSVYVYNGSTYFSSEQLYSRFNYVAELYDQQLIEIMNTYSLENRNTIIPRYIDNYAQNGKILGQSFVYTYVYSDSYMGDTPDNAVIINLSEDWFQNSIGVFSQEDNQVIIINRDGILLNNDKKNNLSALTDISDQPYIQTILGSGEDEGYITAKIDGSDSVVTYKTIYPDNWILLSIAPSSHINASITSIRNQIILIALAITLISIGFIFFLSRQLFIPVNTLAEDNRRFQSEKRTTERLKRQTVINNLLFSPESIAEEDFQKYKLQVNQKDLYLPILLCIDSIRQFYDAFNLSDRELIQYGIINICEEIFPSGQLRECIISGDNSLLLILSPYEAENYEIELTEALTKIRNSLEEYIHFTCTFVIPKTPCLLASLRSCYNTLQELSGLRMLLGKGSIIFSSRHSFINMKEFSYPSEKEAQMSEAIMTFKKEEVSQIVHEILSYAIKFGTTVLNSCVSRLLISINSTILQLQSSNNLRIEYSFDLLQEQISSQETLQEVEECLNRSLTEIWQQFEASRANRYDRLINQILNYIDENYTSPSLCSNSIAEYVGLSASYLSKLFKQYKNISISSYIDSLRLEKAHSLLMNNNISIKKAMEQTGFASRSHFYTVYKAKYGATPSELRKG